MEQALGLKFHFLSMCRITGEVIFYTHNTKLDCQKRSPQFKVLFRTMEQALGLKFNFLSCCLFHVKILHFPEHQILWKQALSNSSSTDLYMMPDIDTTTMQ